MGDTSSDNETSVKQTGSLRQSVWERFDRRQRTGARLSPPSGMRRGVYRFKTHAEQNEWEWTTRLKNLGTRGKPT